MELYSITDEWMDPLFEKIPDKKAGTGALICLSKEFLPLAENVWITPAHLI